METKRIKSMVVYFYDGEKLTDDGYDLTGIVDDYIQLYGQKLFVTCYDPTNEAIEAILDKQVQLIVDCGEKKIEGKAQAHIHKPEIPTREFGLQTQLVFVKL